MWSRSRTHQSRDEVQFTFIIKKSSPSFSLGTIQYSRSREELQSLVDRLLDVFDDGFGVDVFGFGECMVSSHLAIFGN